MTDSAPDEVWTEAPPTRPGVYDFWSPSNGYVSAVNVYICKATGKPHPGLSTPPLFTDGSRWRRVGHLPSHP